jgi:hypothetical protein
MLTLNPTKLLLSNPTHPTWLNQDLADLQHGSSREKKSNPELTCFELIDLTDQLATWLKTSQFFFNF